MQSPAALDYNPRHTGYRCLRCSANYLEYHHCLGCLACRRAGYPASVVAGFTPDTTPFDRVVVLGRSPLGEGDTPLVECEEIAEAVGMARVALKREDLNPTGSHKDRFSAQVVWHATSRRESLVAASSGNAAISLATYARCFGCRCTIFLSDTAPATVCDAIRGDWVDLEVCPTHERWLRMARRVELGDRPVTNHLALPAGSDPIGVCAYRRVGVELAREAPSGWGAVLVPTARGDLLYGVTAGLLDAYHAGLTHRVPKVYGIEPFPRLKLVLAGSDYRSRFEGTTRQHSIASTTVTYQAVWALRETNGGVVVVDDRQCKTAQLRLRALGVNVELCAAGPLSALQLLARQGRLGPHESAVLVLTARDRGASEM